MAHLYNLRTVAGYRVRRQQWAKMRPPGIAIGERRARSWTATRATCASTVSTKAMKME